MQSNFEVKLKYTKGSAVQNKTTTLSQDPTVKELKSTIQQLFEIPEDQQKVIYKGKMIEDHGDVKLVEKYKLEPGANIMVLLKKPANAPNPEKKLSTNQNAQQNQQTNIANPIPVNNPPQQQFVLDEAKLANLIELGFVREDIVPALTLAKNDVNLAYEFLESGIPEE